MPSIANKNWSLADYNVVGNGGPNSGKILTKYSDGDDGYTAGGGDVLWTATSDFDHSRPGFLQFRTSRLDTATTGNVDIVVERVGGYAGAVSCRVVANSTAGDMAMTSGVHFTALSEVVSFEDGQAGAKKVTLSIDSIPSSGLRMVVITMDTATGDVVLRNPEMHVYVDDGGINPNATIVTAGSNIETAANAASAGDLIYLRDGTYTKATRNSGQTYQGFHITSSGTQFAKIMIASYPGEQAVVDQLYATTSDSQGEGTTVGFIVDGDYLHFRRIEVTKCLHSGFVRSESGGEVSPVIEECHIHNLGNPPNALSDYLQEFHADNIGGTLMDGSFGCIQRHNVIHDIYDVRSSSGQSNPWNAYAAGGHSGIHGFNLKYPWIHNNTIYRVRKGVFQKHPDQAGGINHRIHANKFSEIEGDCVALQVAGSGSAGSHDVHVYENLAILQNAYEGTVPLVSLSQKESDTVLGERTSDLWIFNNTQIGGDELYRGGDCNNAVAFSNLQYNSNSNIALEGDSAGGSTVNNLAYCDYNQYSGGTFRILTSRYAGTTTYSTLSAWRAAYPADTFIKRDADENSITTAPTFVDAGNDDYRTTSGTSLNAGRFGRAIGIGSADVGAS